MQDMNEDSLEVCEEVKADQGAGRKQSLSALAVLVNDGPLFGSFLLSWSRAKP